MTQSYCCNADLVWEIWTCDKNPEGIIPQPEHGNYQDDGSTLCDDDYCNPQTVVLDETPTEEYIRTHECHPRCSKCDCLTGE